MGTGARDERPRAGAGDRPRQRPHALQHGDVLFIDEIHRLPVAVEEFIYPAMEDFKIDVPSTRG